MAAPDAPPPTSAVPRARLQAVSKPALFQLALGQRPCSRSAHFAAHHVGPRRLDAAVAAPGEPARATLSTGDEPSCPQPVEQPPRGRKVSGDRPPLQVGWIVPKRHARRSVTRNLIRRAMREAVALAQPPLAPGLWVLRLHRPFDRAQFPSASSRPLARAVRDELRQLLARAATRRREDSA